jgi:hypothetical protein
MAAFPSPPRGRKRHLDDGAAYDARWPSILGASGPPPTRSTPPLIITPSTSPGLLAEAPPPPTSWAHALLDSSAPSVTLSRRRLPQLRLSAAAADAGATLRPPGSLESPAHDAAPAPLDSASAADAQRAASVDESAAALLAQSPSTAVPRDLDDSPPSAVRVAHWQGGGMGLGARRPRGAPAPAIPPPPVDPVTRCTPPVFLRRGVPLFQVGATPKGGGGAGVVGLHVQAATSFSPAHGLAVQRTPPARAATAEGWAEGAHGWGGRSVG